MQRFNNLPNLNARRRELRQNETLQEKLLWWHLRANRIEFKFKRQHSIGGYIADFYCAEKKLVIELDGKIHNSNDAQEYDRIRDGFLKEFGCKVIRFSNSEVDADVYQVLTKIKEILASI
jgi:very-short-patch-repair endonuclease